MGDSAKTSKETKAKAPKKQSFFKGLKKEFKKVTWPDKDALVKETTAVVVISVVMGIVIALMDIVIQSGVNWLTTF